MKILKKPIILNKRPISELLIEGYERTHYVQPAGDTCGDCRSTNTLRWRLRKLVFMRWIYRSAVECKNCIWEDIVDSPRSKPKKRIKKTSHITDSNLNRFKSLPHDLQIELLRKSGLI